MSNPQQQFFNVLHRQARIVEQMAHDPRLPVEVRPVVAELAAACHVFDVQARCLNTLKSYVPDLVGEYAATIMEADVWSQFLSILELDHGAGKQVRT